MVGSIATFGRGGVTPDFQRTRVPTAADDTSDGIFVGSLWVNTSTGNVYICTDNTAGAAVWGSFGAAPFGAQSIASLVGANMNATTDQAFVFSVANGTKVKIRSILAVNPSTSLTTAAGGIYPTTAKGGTPIVAATQAYSVLTGINLTVSLTLATIAATTLYTAGATAVYLALTTAQGGAATADLYMYGDILPTG